MGFARRVVRKSVRRATPRPVRQAMHPARTARNAVTPRPVEQASRAVYSARHPVEAAENAVIGAALYPPRPRSRQRHRGRFMIGGVILGLITLAVLPWWVPVLIILAAIVIPLIAWRTLDPSQRRRIRQ
jgi:chromate transport protein ChrA